QAPLMKRKSVRSASGGRGGDGGGVKGTRPGGRGGGGSKPVGEPRGGPRSEWPGAPPARGGRGPRYLIRGWALAARLRRSDTPRPIRLVPTSNSDTGSGTGDKVVLLEKVMIEPADSVIVRFSVIEYGPETNGMAAELLAS